MDKCLLVSYTEGGFQLNEPLLQKLLEPIKKKRTTTPLAIVSFTGPPGSGKSFYSNLLIHYLENKSLEWLTTLSNIGDKKTKPLQGFQFGNVANSSNIVSASSKSGVYVWPKLLEVKTYDGKMAVCVLHPHHNLSDEIEQSNISPIFNRLLHELCTRIIEIGRQNDQIVEGNNEADMPAADEKIDASKLPTSNIFQLKITSEPAPSENHHEINNSPSTRRLTHNNIAFIQESEQPLHTDSGKLTLTKDLHVQIDTAIKLIADANKICNNADGNDISLTVSSMQEHFSSCIQRINSCEKNELTKDSEKVASTSSLFPENGQNCGGHPLSTSTENLTETSENTGVTTRNKKVRDKERKKQQKLEEAQRAAEAERIKQDEEAREAEEQAKIQAREEARIAEENAKRAEEEEKAAKEEARKAEEKKVQLLANEACTQVEHRMVTHLDTWLGQSSILSDVNFCASIYLRSINETLLSKATEVSKMQMHEIQNFIEDTLKFRKIELEKIHDIITRFQYSIESHMQTHICFPQDQTVNELNKHFHIENISDVVTKYAQTGCDKLASSYLAQNERIVAIEVFLLNQSAEEIFNVYKMQMSEMLTIIPFNPARLSELNLELLKRCLEKLRCLQRSQPPNVVGTSFILLNVESELNLRMNQIYRELRLTNIEKLRELFIQIKPAIQKHKAKYCNEMEKLMGQSANGIPKETFFNQNVTLRTNETKLLCQEIQRIIRENEPTDGYIKTLEWDIDTAWLAFQDLNSQKLNTRTTEDKVEVPTVSAKKKELSPIIFQLSLSRIGTYIYEDPKLLTFGFSSTTVGETEDGLLRCEFQYSNQNEQPKFARSWKLSQCLFPEQRGTNKEELMVGETPHKIITELILGLLFHTLKQRVENQLNGESSACVITVPFWLTSQQRRQVKDSGKVVGFQEVYLVNENSAIALYLCRTNRDEEKNDVVILSENSGRVDATIYSYDKSQGGVKIVGHCGDYETCVKPTSTVGKIKETYKLAQKIRDEKLYAYEKIGWNQKSKTVAIAFESEDYKNVLMTLGKEIATKKTVRGVGETMVVLGAQLFCQNPGAKRKTMQDWLSASIFRKIGSGAEECIQDKKDYNLLLYSEARNRYNSFSLLNEAVYFFQKDVNGQNKPIAGLKLDSPTYRKWMEVNLLISSESIVTLEMKNKMETDIILSHGWLDETSLTVYSSLFVSFQKLELEIRERNKRKKELITQGNDLLHRANNVQFRSKLAQEMAVTQIQEALNLLSHPKITANDIEKQLELFRKYETKFSPQS